MAKRPVFIANTIDADFYTTKSIEFTWYPGYSVSQKRKSINSLHNNFMSESGEFSVLEVSSKSENILGAQLSAFNLRISHSEEGLIPLECAFQASKNFEFGGPYLDLLTTNPYKVKKDPRLKESGKIIGFVFDGENYPNNPTTFFYNWLYLKALDLNKDLSKEIVKFDSFTDIEFNPLKSVNCQAKACALYVSLYKRGLLEKALLNQQNFKDVLCVVERFDRNNLKNIQVKLEL
jgi:type I restriction enzyme M protein